MILKMESTQTYPKYPRQFDFAARHPEQVSASKIYSVKDMIICSFLIFATGISLGVAIMQYITQ